jgi:1,2-diacylglycerol 3-alpha-glucosyltransferase
MSLSFNRTLQYLANNYNIPLIFGTSIESIKINKERGIIGENQRTKLMLPIIDHDKFKKIDKKLEIFKNGKFNVIFCGRIAPEKKIDILIKTMQFTSKTRLFIIGDGTYLNNLKEIAKEFKVDDKVNFLGKIPNNELAKYYSSADVFATASECETCGFTTIEAMTCGLIALVYPRGGSINLIDDGVNGFFCKTSKEFAKK